MPQVRSQIGRISVVCHLGIALIMRSRILGEGKSVYVASFCYKQLPKSLEIYTKLPLFARKAFKIDIFAIKLHKATQIWIIRYELEHYSLAANLRFYTFIEVTNLPG